MLVVSAVTSRSACLLSYQAACCSLRAKLWRGGEVVTRLRKRHLIGQRAANSTPTIYPSVCHIVSVDHSKISFLFCSRICATFASARAEKELQTFILSHKAYQNNIFRLLHIHGRALFESLSWYTYLYCSPRSVLRIVFALIRKKKGTRKTLQFNRLILTESPKNARDCAILSAELVRFHGRAKLYYDAVPS